MRMAAAAAPGLGPLVRPTGTAPTPAEHISVATSAARSAHDRPADGRDIGSSCPSYSDVGQALGAPANGAQAGAAVKRRRIAEDRRANSNVAEADTGNGLAAPASSAPAGAPAIGAPATGDKLPAPRLITMGRQPRIGMPVGYYLLDPTAPPRGAEGAPRRHQLRQGDPRQPLMSSSGGRRPRHAAQAQQPRQAQ